MNENFDFSGFRSIAEIIMDLKKPLAIKHLDKRKQGGKDILYISWSIAVKYMDLYANGWFSEIRRIESVAGKLILTARVTIPTKHGFVYREATGQEDETLDSYGDSSSNAEAQAIKRAFAKFGLGLYLYDLTEQEKAMLINGKQIELKIARPVLPADTANNAPNIPPSNAPVSEAKPPSDEIAEKQEKDASKANTGESGTNQSQGKSDNPKDLPIAERIENAKAKIREFGVKPFEAKKDEKESDYFDRLTKQYKAIINTPSVLTDEEKAVWQNRQKSESGTSGVATVKQSKKATGSQIETLENLIKKLKVSMIDVVQEYTGGEHETFEDVSSETADTIIAHLADELKAKAEKKK